MTAFTVQRAEKIYEWLAFRSCILAPCREARGLPNLLVWAIATHGMYKSEKKEENKISLHQLAAMSNVYNIWQQ